MKKNKIRVIISTGQGRLHLIDSAKALNKHGVITQIITGWIPSRNISNRLLDFIGNFVGRKGLASGLRKRVLSEVNLEKVSSCTFSEFFFQFLNILTRLNIIRRDKAFLYGWKLFGWQSKRNINNADILHVRSGAGQGGAIRKARLMGMKIVVDHSIAHPNEVYKQLLKANNNNSDGISIFPNSAFWQIVIKDCTEADIIQVNSEYVKNSFINNGFKSSRIKVIPLGIRNDFWSLKKRYSFSGPVKILFTGGFGRRKGAHLMIQLCEALISDGVNFKFDVIGSVVDDIDLPIWFKESNKIFLHGHLPQENLYSYLIEADLYIFPSYSEGAAQSLKEAMAAGLPVIATEQSGAPIIDGENGLLIKDDSVGDLKKAVNVLRFNEDLREKIGRNACKTIQSNHTWEKYAESTNSLYEQLI